MILTVKTDKCSDETFEVVIPLWHIKMLTPVDGKEDLFKFKIDDTWTNYYVDRDTAEKIATYISSKEYADMRN